MIALALFAGAGLKGILIGFLFLILLLAVIAGLLWFIETYINKGPFPPPVRFVIALVCVIVIVIWALGATGCTETKTFFQSQGGQAIIATSEQLAKTAVEAAATQHGGPIAGQLAGAALDALATVLQGYIGQPVPSQIIHATPGNTIIANALAPLISSNKPITQADVNALYAAATIATK